MDYSFRYYFGTRALFLRYHLISRESNRAFWQATTAAFFWPCMPSFKVKGGVTKRQKTSGRLNTAAENREKKLVGQGGGGVASSTMIVSATTHTTSQACTWLTPGLPWLNPPPRPKSKKHKKHKTRKRERRRRRYLHSNHRQDNLNPSFPREKESGPLGARIPCVDFKIRKV